MIFREPVSDADWIAACNLRNLYHWNDAITLERYQSLYETGKIQRIEYRLLGFEEDVPLVYLGGSENKNSTEPNNFWAYIGFDPAVPNARELADECWRYTLDYVKKIGGALVQTETRSSYPFEVEALEQLGFEKIMTLPFSGVMVKETNFSRQDGVITFAEFAEQNPNYWLHRIWRLEMDICADLPLPHPFVETPFEVFAERVSDSTVDKTTKYLFQDGREIVGLTQLWYSKVSPQYAATGLTGALRHVRRQGVATRLKQHSLAIAKENGVEQVFTDNEENNPMFLLNLQLGFKKLFDYYVYRKYVD